MFYIMIASYQISEISLRYQDYVNYIKSLLAVMIKKVLRVYLTHSVLNYAELRSHSLQINKRL